MAKKNTTNPSTNEQKSEHMALVHFVQILNEVHKFAASIIIFFIRVYRKKISFFFYLARYITQCY